MPTKLPGISSGIRWCEVSGMQEKLKPILSYNADISKNAYLNWRIAGHNIAGNLTILAESFENAAKELMQSVLRDNRLKQADSLIFPIMYSVDQSIELYLKAIIYNIECLTTGQPNNYTTHDIQSLFNTMISQIKKKEIKTKGLQAHVSVLQEYIDELYSYIKSGDGKAQLDFARYPFDTDRNPHFYVCAHENVVIDIENLLDRYSKIMDCLYGLYCMYDAELEALN